MITADTSCCIGGWIAPNGDYYGTNNPDITYIHLGLSNKLMKDGIIPESKNPDRWLELNGWIKQHGSAIISLDSAKNEKPITNNQIKTLINVIGQNYKILDFVNQEKYIFISDLINENKWQLHYKLIN